MRIISGKYRGTSLYEPLDEHTRPLKDIARESIFNLLEHSNKFIFKFNYSNILDLYSGTGSFGLECLSRNANHVSFVENKKSAINILEKNIKKLNIEKKTKVFFSDVFNYLEKQKISKLEFDLIFCDPPFKNEQVNKLLELIVDNKILDKNGILVLHRNKTTKEIFPDYLNIIDERIYGISKIFFVKFLT